MDIVSKLKLCIAYCRDQSQVSNGEILQEVTEEDFDEMMMIVETILED